MFCNSKIADLWNFCLESYINMSVEDAVLAIKSRLKKHIRISSLTFRKVESSKESVIRDNLLFCTTIPSFDESTILACGYHKYILKIKERFLIKRDRHVLNKNIKSSKLFFLTIIRTLIVSIILRYR